MALILVCPDCRKRLQVPDELIGQKVQCPDCKQTFTATDDTAIPSTAVGAVPPPVPRLTDEERPSRTRARRYEDDEDEDDDRPLRRSRRVRRDYDLPHRGGMILAFGIVALFFLPFVFGPMAWLMGNNDLRDMREGRMDPEGEGMTQAGRIIGIIATILFVVTLLFVCGMWAFFALIIGAAAVGGAKGIQKG